jgi:1-deoxy-D-xylulose-5-phosphate synthase
MLERPAVRDDRSAVGSPGEGCALSDSLFESIASPEELKVLDGDQLAALATEVRTRLVETVARTGGHLAPNLGVVELTIGLLRALDTPRDRIIWDVGHQS